MFCNEVHLFVEYNDKSSEAEEWNREMILFGIQGLRQAHIS